ncbi:MAG: dihydroorotate dehydrogenase electron transfer subunit [Armatimonadota bacterium]|nr:dihydroorotate dehydrogenase electron transfer subunit [Armatimonadota bacterium]
MARAVAILKRRENVAPGHYLLELSCPEIARSAEPGQFVHLRVGDGTDPLLRRPFSVMLTRPSAGEVQVLVRTVGRGTELIADHEVGTRYDLLGPLGHGWRLPEATENVMLVAGGVGVAPLIFLADHLRTAEPKPYVRAIFGGATEDALACWTEFASRCEEFTAVTEDGTAGETGMATDVLASEIERDRPDRVYACGPDAMLVVVAGICRQAEVAMQASMEQWMGCGVGACLGCAIPAAGGGYVRVCTEGPVFAAEEIDWERMTPR